LSENIEYLKVNLPEQKNYEYAYGLAFKLAAEKLSNIKDLEKQCLKSGSECQISGIERSISLKYLNRIYRVKLPEIIVSSGKEPVELRDKILILHYLTIAKGTPLAENLITYQELEEGAAYYPSFFKRTIKPLIDFFGPYPEKLKQYSAELGSHYVKYGDFAVTIPAFRYIPITLVLWKGDDEFPPNGNILFDSTILDYLSVEDVNILSQTIVWKLVKSFQQDKSK
jgi:hypothetical protein